MSCRALLMSLQAFHLWKHVLFDVFWIWWQLQDPSKEELETTEQSKVRKSHVPIRLRKSADSSECRTTVFLKQSLMGAIVKHDHSREREKSPTGWRE